MIRAANSQPYSHIHQPGIGVGGHCIPVYPHFLLSRAPDMELVRAVQADQRRRSWTTWSAPGGELGGLRVVPVLVLGLTYREGVKELAYSRGLALIDRLAEAGRTGLGVGSAALATRSRPLRRGPWTWGHASPRARSSPRPPTRVRAARRGLVRPISRSSSTAGTACATSRSRHPCGCWASGSRFGADELVVSAPILPSVATIRADQVRASITLWLDLQMKPHGGVRCPTDIGGRSPTGAARTHHEASRMGPCSGRNRGSHEQRAWRGSRLPGDTVRR